MEGYELKPITLARIQDKALSRTTDWKKYNLFRLFTSKSSQLHTAPLNCALKQEQSGGLEIESQEQRL